MEMFVLSYANVLCIYPKLCLQVGSTSLLRTYLTNQYVTLRYCSPNLCKRNYLYGDLPFFKIQVNHFMAQDEPFGAKIITKYILWVRGLAGCNSWGCKELDTTERLNWTELNWIYVTETICMVICPSSRFKLIILWPKMNHLVPRLSPNASYGGGAWCRSEFSDIPFFH